MSKYIIKNCEQIHGSDNVCWNKNVRCQDCTDCVMKQIVELLKSPNNCRYSGKPLVFTDDILPLLDIQEVE